MKKPRFSMADILILLFFLVLLSLNLFFHRIGDYGAETNFYGLYAPQAQSILQGQLPVGDYHGPAYPLLLALAYLVFGNFLLAGIFLSTAAAALTLFLVLRLLRRVLDPKMAAMAAALVALNPVFIQHSYSAGSDMLFVLLVTLCLYLLLRSDDFSWTGLVLAALAAALAYLTRYNGIAVVAAAFIIVLVINHWRLPLKKRLLAFFVFASLFLALITPWGIHCLRQKGSFFFNQNYKTAACELYAQGRVTYEQFWFDRQTLGIDSFADVLTYDPVRLGKRLGANLARHFARDMRSLLGWPVAVFVLIGFANLLVRRPTRVQYGFYAYSFLFFCVLLFVLYDPRYSIFLLLCYSALAMNGLQLAGRALKRPWLETGLAVVLVAWTAFASFGFNKRNIASGPREVAKAAAWYRRSVPPGERGKIMLARKPHLPYHTGMEFRMLPLAESPADLEDKLRQLPGDFLFISPIEVFYRGNLKGLLEPENAPGSFIPVYQDDDPPAVLYRIRRDRP